MPPAFVLSQDQTLRFALGQVSQPSQSSGHSRTLLIRQAYAERPSRRRRLLIPSNPTMPKNTAGIFPGQRRRAYKAAPRGKSTGFLPLFSHPSPTRQPRPKTCSQHKTTTPVRRHCRLASEEAAPKRRPGRDISPSPAAVQSFPKDFRRFRSSTPSCCVSRNRKPARRATDGREIDFAA